MFLSLSCHALAPLQDDGVKNSAMIKKCLDYWPAMRPLVLVLKQFLYNRCSPSIHGRLRISTRVKRFPPPVLKPQRRDLHETYTGGMGSYLLAMTVVSMLQNHPGHGPEHKVGENNLGALLLEYLSVYGMRLNYDEIGIKVAEGGGVFPLTGDGGFLVKQEMGWRNNDRAFLLSVQDPLMPDSDVGRNSFNFRGIKLAMEQAYWTLLDPNMRRPHGETALGSILRL